MGANTQNSNIGTFLLTEADSPFVIHKQQSVLGLSLLLISGSVSIKGNMSLVNQEGTGSRACDIIDLTTDAPTYSFTGPEPLDGFVITIGGGGSCQLTTFRN